ncbi:hypothetical protein AB0C40_20870 [Streptomyces brevispora]
MPSGLQLLSALDTPAIRREEESNPLGAVEAPLLVTVIIRFSGHSSAA